MNANIFSVFASILLFSLPVSAVEVEIEEGLYPDMARKWIAAIIENKPDTMVEISKFPVRCFEIDIKSKNDLEDLLLSPQIVKWQDFHKKDGWEFAIVKVIDPKSFTGNMDVENKKLVFVRIVDDLEKGRKQELIDSVVVFEPGPNPVIVGWIND